MGKEIIIEATYAYEADSQAISLEEWRKKKERRRKRVAKRLAIRFPLFAVEFAREEFPNYTQELFEADLQGKKLPKKRKGKSPMKRQGRYQPMQQALSNYRQTGDQDFLIKAQRLRNRMFKPFLIEYRIGKERRQMQFPSTTSFKVVTQLTQIKFKTWEELDRALDEKLKWAHVG